MTEQPAPVEAAQTAFEKENQWFSTMRAFLLGFYPTDAMEKLYNEISFVPEDKEAFLARIDKELGQFMAPASKKSDMLSDEMLINDSLPLAKGGFIPLRKKFFYSWETFEKINLAPWVKKSFPDNCLIKKFNNNHVVYDIRCFEECGFVEIGDWLVSRTVQPYTIVADVETKNEEGKKVTKEEPQAIYPTIQSKTGLICIIPKMTEEEFYNQVPFVPGLDNMGVQFTGEFEVGMINPEFAVKYNIPCTAAFVLRRNKTKLKMNRAASKLNIDRDFYRGAIVV